MGKNLQSWIESHNPFLHVLAPSGDELSFAWKTVDVLDAEVIVLGSVDLYDYKPLLDAGKIVVLVEKEEKKVYSLIHQKDFFFDKNLYVVSCREQELLFVARKLLWKSVAYIGNCEKFKAVMDGVNISISEYRDLGEKIIPNIARNMWHQKEYIDGRDVVDLLKGEEIAVFGNGISINDGICTILKMEKRPYIIACGSSLAVLVEKGIIPDFFVAIDPDVDMALYKCLDDLEIAMFYQNKVCSELFAQHRGPKIFMGSAKGWDIEASLLAKIRMGSFFFDAGYNAGNFGAHVALTLGCRKVYLIGMDSVSKDNEEKTKVIDGLDSRADLVSGMHFFKELLGYFKDQEIVQFSKGLYFDKDRIVKELSIAPKKERFELPKTKILEGSKGAIAEAFPHELDALFKDFFVKEEGMTKEGINYALAEISLFPIYQSHFMQMFSIYADFFDEESKDPLFKLTFFKNVWDKIYRKIRALECHDKRYDERGELVSFQEMKNGARCGRYEFYRDGKCIRKGQFVDGKLDGEHKSFKDEILVDKVCYEKGKKVGVHSYFNDAGILLEELTYHGDVFDREEFTDYGEKTYSGIWDEGHFFETFYEKGKVIRKRRGILVEKKMVFEEIR